MDVYFVSLIDCCSCQKRVPKVILRLNISRTSKSECSSKSFLMTMMTTVAVSTMILLYFTNGSGPGCSCITVTIGMDVGCRQTQKSFTVLIICFFLYVECHTTTRRGPDVTRRPACVQHCFKAILVIAPLQ